MNLPTPFEIRSSKKEDLRLVAVCHRSAFPESLSTAMGAGYVEKMLEWYLMSGKTFLLLLESHGQCLGYCGGMIRDQYGEGSASSMVQYSFWAGVIAFVKRPWLLFHPELRTKFPLIFRNILNRFTRRGEIKNLDAQHFEPYMGLVVIGVQPQFHGKGYGTLLLQEFEKRTLENGLSKMQLSVRSDNARAIRSYSNNGWSVKLVRRNSIVMEKILA